MTTSPSGRSVVWVLLAVGDGAAWVVGSGLAVWVRYAFEETQVSGSGLLVVVFVAVVVQWFVGVVGCMYRGRFALGSVDEAINLARVMFVVGLVVLGVDLVPGTALVPRSVPLSATLVALGSAVGMRLVVRRVRERAERPDESSAQRAIIFGTSVSGQQLLHSICPAGTRLPVSGQS